MNEKTKTQKQTNKQQIPKMTKEIQRPYEKWVSGPYEKIQSYHSLIK